MRLFAWLLLGMLAIGLMPDAWAANPTCSGGSLALTLPAVTVTHNTAVGTLLGTPTSGTASFSCSNLPNNANSPTREAGIQIYNLAASQLVPATLPSTTNLNINTLTFATNLAGIGVQLTISPGMRGYDQNAGDQQPGSYVVGYVAAPGGGLSVNYTAQLVVTGTVTTGTISSLTLLKYEWYIYGCSNCNGASTSASLGTTLSVNGQVSLQGCGVNTDSQAIAVVLPTVSTSTFTGIGATTGRTPFKINLTCQTGTTMLITMTTSNPYTTGGVNGVVAPAGTGYASNIGVQLLSGAGAFPPVTFNTAQNLGASPTGIYSIPYYAQYYETAATVGSGSVAATVTFTMSYQ